MILIHSFLPFVLMLIGLHGAELVTRHVALRPVFSKTILLAFGYRTVGLLLPFLALTSLSGRPWHSAFVVFIAGIIILSISVIKRRILAEPLVVTDFYLVRQAIENPRLYYLDLLGKFWVQAVLLVVLAALIAATFLWFSIEPPYNTRGLCAVLLVLIGGGLFFYRTSLGETARSLIRADAASTVASYGLVGSLLIGVFARKGFMRPSTSALYRAHSLPRPRSDAAPVVVGIQLESFVDLHSRGLNYGPALSGVALLRQESMLHGPLTVPAEGAYTMRTEAAVLTGLTPDDFGVDATDPYLALDRYTLPTLASRFGQAGYRTIFIHPHDARFFRRNHVVPALGFDHFISGDDFTDARCYGPYVCDEDLGNTIAALVEHYQEPLFIVAVTLENHGPWQKGRLDGIDEPLEQYYTHLAHTDAMLASLRKTLQTLNRPAVLCAWGDHVPARTLPLDVGNRLETDYFLWSNRPNTAPPLYAPLYAHDLPRAILEHS